MVSNRKVRCASELVFIINVLLLDKSKFEGPAHVAGKRYTKIHSLRQGLRLFEHTRAKPTHTCTRTTIQMKLPPLFRVRAFVISRQFRVSPRREHLIFFGWTLCSHELTRETKAKKNSKSFAMECFSKCRSTSNQCLSNEIFRLVQKKLETLNLFSNYQLQMHTQCINAPIES